MDRTCRALLLAVSAALAGCEDLCKCEDAFQCTEADGRCVDNTVEVCRLEWCGCNYWELKDDCTARGLVCYAPNPYEAWCAPPRATLARAGVAPPWTAGDRSP